METLRLINYKCFEDTDTFCFKPINLLVEVPTVVEKVLF